MGEYRGLDSNLSLQFESMIALAQCLTPRFKYMEPRAEDRGHWITHPRLAYSVAATQLGLVGFVRSAVRGPTAGVTAPNRYNRTAGPWTGPPPVIGPRASDHGPLELAL